MPEVVNKVLKMKNPSSKKAIKVLSLLSAVLVTFILFSYYLVEGHGIFISLASSLLVALLVYGFVLICLQQLLGQNGKEFKAPGSFTSNKNNRISLVNAPDDIESLKKLTDYVVLDTETTGLSPEKDQVVEIGIITVKNGEITNEYTSLIKPTIPISSEATELRNTSTHFITEEYEMVYVPLFQSCVFNYTEKLHDFFGIEANKYVPQNFLTLTVSMRPLDVEEIRAKYPPKLANRLLQASADIQSLSAEENNAAFAIRIEHYHYITKDKDKATSTIHIDKNAETSGVIIKEIQDPNNVYPFNEKRCITRINKRLASDGVAVTINSYHFRLFVQHYGIKSNPKLCYSYNVPSHPMYSYSMATIDLIVMEIEKDPENILQVLKERSKKEETPGAKDSKH